MFNDKQPEAIPAQGENTPGKNEAKNDLTPILTMTIRAFSLALYALSTTPPTRENQLRHLALLARQQLDNARLDGREKIIQASTRFLIQAEAMLDRIELRQFKEGPTPQQKKNDREFTYDREAMVRFLYDREELQEEFLAVRAEVVEEFTGPGGCFNFSS
jgi:hypothetical protein